MYKLLDWYEDPNIPDLIGTFETEEKAKKACMKYSEDTDGECKLEIVEEDK